MCAECGACVYACNEHEIKFKCCRNNWTISVLRELFSLFSALFRACYRERERKCRIIMMIKWKFVACVIVGFSADIPGHYKRVGKLIPPVSPCVFSQLHFSCSIFFSFSFSFASACVALLHRTKSAHNFNDDDL